MSFGDMGAEREELRLVGDVGNERADRHPGRSVGEREKPGFVHRRGRHVADRHAAPGGGELAGELPTHPRASAGQHGKAAFELFHRVSCLLDDASRRFCYVVSDRIGSGTAGVRRSSTDIGVWQASYYCPTNG